MFQRNSFRTAPRVRSLAVGGALAALAVVGGGTVVAVTAPGAVTAGDVQLIQNAAAMEEMAVGTPVSLDLEPIVAEAAGGTVPAGTTVQVTGLPDGLVQDGWVISGAPTRAGTYDVLVTVSNGGLSQSEQVQVKVTDGAGEATTAEDESGEGTSTPSTTSAPAPQAAGAQAAADGATEEEADGATEISPEAATEGATETSPEAATDGMTEGATDGTTDGSTEGTTESSPESTTTTPATPDLCAALGGGEVDSASLAEGLAPILGGEGASVPTGFVTVLVDMLARMLPSVLGDTGSLGTLACSLQPILTGGSGTAPAVDDPTTTVETVPAGTQEQAGTDAGGAGALMGLLGAGAGSLGG